MTTAAHFPCRSSLAPQPRLRASAWPPCHPPPRPAKLPPPPPSALCSVPDGARAELAYQLRRESILARMKMGLPVPQHDLAPVREYLRAQVGWRAGKGQRVPRLSCGDRSGAALSEPAHHTPSRPAGRRLGGARPHRPQQRGQLPAQR